MLVILYWILCMENCDSRITMLTRHRVSWLSIQSNKKGCSLKMILILKHKYFFEKPCARFSDMYEYALAASQTTLQFHGYYTTGSIYWLHLRKLAQRWTYSFHTPYTD